MSVAMHHKTGRLFLIAALACAWVSLVRADDMHTDKLRPIIAQLVTTPEQFEGRRIQIYGLVVASDPANRTFMLQDVSQRPLLIDATSLKPVAEGEQVEIEGVLKRTGQDVAFVARKIKRVQVIAGGGCC